MKTPATATLPVAFVPVDVTIPCRGELLVDMHEQGLADMYKLIGCELVERVPHLLALEEAEMWVDEEGSCRRGARRNLRASMIAGVTIYGNAIITGRDLTCLRMDCPKAFFDNVQTLAEEWMAKHNEK
jgi:hypothetical protein